MHVGVLASTCASMFGVVQPLRRCFMHHHHHHHLQHQRFFLRPFFLVTVVNPSSSTRGGGGSSFSSGLSSCLASVSSSGSIAAPSPSSPSPQPSICSASPAPSSTVPSSPSTTPSSSLSASTLAMTSCFLPSRLFQRFHIVKRPPNFFAFTSLINWKNRLLMNSTLPSSASTWKSSRITSNRRSSISVCLTGFSDLVNQSHRSSNK
mmetsp:Transcript_6383/g.11999  ORF Transcript_6383/g.11999 Transcript_6383/m.11999 type:complete len:206 (-) Transcript_6383:165-782(-)